VSYRQRLAKPRPRDRGARRNVCPQLLSSVSRMTSRNPDGLSHSVSGPEWRYRITCVTRAVISTQGATRTTCSTSGYERNSRGMHDFKTSFAIAFTGVLRVRETLCVRSSQITIFVESSSDNPRGCSSRHPHSMCVRHFWGRTASGADIHPYKRRSERVACSLSFRDESHIDHRGSRRPFWKDRP
jgi:hypothetical protein